MLAARGFCSNVKTSITTAPTRSITCGQALLTKRMGRTRVIAETSAGQHGVCNGHGCRTTRPRMRRLHGRDTQRQALNVGVMQLLGATVIPVTAGSRTLKDAINEAMRDWVTNVDQTHYLGTVAGPAPFPEMVRHFHAIIGREAREQTLEMTGRLPDVVAACVGGEVMQLESSMHSAMTPGCDSSASRLAAKGSNQVATQPS